MAFPATGSRGDTRLLAWRKVLGYLQNQAGALAANNPNKNDGLRTVLRKVLNALHGQSGEGHGTFGTVVSASGGGGGGGNQRYVQQANGSWLGTDGDFMISFSSANNRWEISRMTIL